MYKASGFVAYAMPFIDMRIIYLVMVLTCEPDLIMTYNLEVSMGKECNMMAGMLVCT